MPILGVSVPIADYLDIGTFFKITSVGGLISGILGAALLIGSLVFVLYFAWAALRWLTAGGDKTQIEMARQRITNAFIGLILLAASWAIYLIVIYVLGLPITIASNGGGNGGNGGIPDDAVCLYPVSRCCDDITDSTCYCQNVNYRAVQFGPCIAGGGNTGVWCDCVHI